MADQSKNSRAHRGKGVMKRMLNGEEVKPVKYVGNHGKYMAGAIDDKMVCDENGRPYPLQAGGGRLPGPRRLKMAPRSLRRRRN